MKNAHDETESIRVDFDSKNRPFESENIKKVWKNFFSRPQLFTWRKVSIRINVEESDYNII